MFMKQTSMLTMLVFTLLCNGSNAYLLDVECSNSHDVYFFGDPYNCSIYYECNRGSLYTLYCPLPLVWNQKNGYCDDDKYVGCWNGTSAKPDTTTSIPTSAKPGTTTASPSGKCPATGTINYEYPGDCTKYYRCINGKEEIWTCPENMYFNPVTSSCGYMDEVVCNYSTSPTPATSTTTTTTTTTTPNPTTSTKAPSGGDCPADQENADTPYPYDCTKFYRCINGKKELRNCPENMYFDPATNICGYERVASCESPTTSPTITPSTTTSSITTPTTTPSTTTKGPDSICSGQPDGYYPDPSSCRKYYQCSNGQATSYSCPANTVFDSNVGACTVMDIDCD